jgi:tRNA pseudouridine13 synthase
MRLKYPRDSFFSKGFRRTWISPANFEFGWANDELHNQRLALDLSFDLPRGCYATMIVRAISSADWQEDDGDNGEEMGDGHDELASPEGDESQEDGAQQGGAKGDATWRDES